MNLSSKFARKETIVKKSHTKILVPGFALFLLFACKPQNNSNSESSITATNALCVSTPSGSSGAQSFASIQSKFNIHGVVRFEELATNRNIKTFSIKDFEGAFPPAEKDEILSAFKSWFLDGYTDINNPASKTGVRSASFLRKGYQSMRGKFGDNFITKTTVYRGLKLNADSINTFLQEMKTSMDRSSPIHLGPGNKPVWASASRRPIIATDRAENSEFGAVLRIHQNSGLTIESLSSRTVYHFEREVLLPPEAKFKVTAINTLEKDGKVVSFLVTMEETSIPSIKLLADAVDTSQELTASEHLQDAGLNLNTGEAILGSAGLSGATTGFSLAGDCEVGLAEEAKTVGQTSGKNALAKAKASASAVAEQQSALRIAALQAASEGHIKEEVQIFTRWLLAKPNVQKVLKGVGVALVAATLADAIYNDLKEGNYKVVHGHVSLHNVSHSHVVKVFASLVGAEMGASAGAAIGNSIFLGIGGFIGGFIGGIGGWELGGRMETWVADKLFPQTSPSVVGRRAENYQAILMASNVKIFTYPADRRVYLTPSSEGEGVSWLPTSVAHVPGWDIYEITELNGKSTGLKMIKSTTKGKCLMAYPQNKSLGLTTCNHARVDQQWKWDVNLQNKNETTIQSILDKNLCVDRYLNDHNGLARVVGLYSCDMGKHNQRWTFGG